MVVRDRVDEPPWCWPQWLSQFPLNRFTVLDYFSHSPFYDEIAKARGVNPAALATANLGFVYVVSHAQDPHLYVIERRTLLDNAGDPGKAGGGMLEAVYIFQDGMITQSPSVHQVFYSRLRQALSSVKKSWESLAEALGVGRDDADGDAKAGTLVAAQLAALPIGDGERAKRVASRAVLRGVLGRWHDAVPKIAFDNGDAVAEPSNDRAGAGGAAAAAVPPRVDGDGGDQEQFNQMKPEEPPALAGIKAESGAAGAGATGGGGGRPGSRKRVRES